MTKSEFQILFNKLFSPLCNYANAIVNDFDKAEDIVQDVLFQFWEKRQELTVESDKFENYLVRAVKFKCIDLHRQDKVKRKYEEDTLSTQQAFADTDEADEVDYQAILFTAITHLPEKTRAVFTMSKIDGLKYGEIADALNISIKTVENQMGRAFKILRTVIQKDHLLIFVLFFIIE